MREIIFYRKENGRVPVDEFLRELPPKLRAKVAGLFINIENSDLYFKMPHSKYLVDDIYEFRVQFANDIARVFYFFIHNGKIVLTNGFVKKTQKTPLKEIERAKEYKKDYERSNK